jgi:hypothetical protein
MESLQGVKGLRIVPIGVMPFMQTLHDLNNNQQIEEIERDMLEETTKGKARLKEYETTYSSAEPDMVPSMKVYIKARHIPALLKNL